MSSLVAGWLRWLALAFVAVVAGCGGGGGRAPVAPSIVNQPASTKAAAGAAATFGVVAVGTAPFSYQWRRNGADVAGANAATYTTPATTAADNGAQYSVVVGNAAGSAVSFPATLTVDGQPAVAPSIVTQPAAVSVQAGQAATFAVVAAGTAPLAYQWRRNGVDIAGANAAAYTTTATVAADDGATFSVVVTNAAGQATSGAAVLTVTPAPVAPAISAQPADATVNAGQTATFSVAASGTAPLAYQWTRNGTAIAGATGTSYTTPAATAADDGATFGVVVANAAGQATSANARLTVTPAVVAPSIRVQPANVTANQTASATFGVTATGTAPLAYQWLRNGTPIAGATAATYTLPAVAAADNGAVFSVVVSNAAGQATSSGATLTVARLLAGAALCSNVALLEPGASARIVMGVNGLGIPITYDFKVNAATTFEGHPAKELQTDIISSVNAPTSSKSYAVFDPATWTTTYYGSLATATATSGGTTVVTETRTVFTPPYESRLFALAAGQSTTETITSVTTQTQTTNGVAAAPTTSTATGTVTGTFGGIEQVTVPAGTFSACRFTSSTVGAGSTAPLTSTAWYLVDYGYPVKLVDAAGQTLAAQSITINGAAFPPP